MVFQTEELNHPANIHVPRSDQLAVLLTGYGGVQDYENFIEYNKRASEYIAAKFAPIPPALYPIVAQLLALRDRFKWGYTHDHFISPQNDVFEQQRQGIEQYLRSRWGDRVQVFSAFYFREPLIEPVVTDIHNKGFGKLLVYPLLVVDSVFTSRIAIEQLNEAFAHRQAQHPWFDDLRYIPSFASCPIYHALMARQVEEAIASDPLTNVAPSEIGIILLVHGGPKNSKGLVTGTEEGQQLYNRVQEKLVHHYPLTSIAWINHDTPFVKWSQPTMKQAAKNLIDVGAKVLVFKPIGWATENYETILEPEEAIASIQRNYPAIATIQLGCANAHPDFLRMAASWAHPDIEALIS